MGSRSPGSFIGRSFSSDGGPKLLTSRVVSRPPARRLELLTAEETRSFTRSIMSWADSSFLRGRSPWIRPPAIRPTSVHHVFRRDSERSV